MPFYRLQLVTKKRSIVISRHVVVLSFLPEDMFFVHWKKYGAKIWENIENWRDTHLYRLACEKKWKLRKTEQKIIEDNHKQICILILFICWFR